MLGGLGLNINQVLAMETTEIIFASVNNPGSRRGNRVLGILTFRGVQHLQEADLNPRGAMEVRCNILRKSALSVAEIIVESAYRELMPALVVLRVDTWLETVHRTEVMLDVMLSLGLNHRVKQQPNLPRGTNSMP